MVSDGFYYCSFIWKFAWIHKIEILTGAFAGFVVYSYFYKQLHDLEKNLNNRIKKVNIILLTINKMGEKSEVQLMLDAVAGFNDSITGFKDGIISTVRTEIKELKTELITYFDKEINRTNTEVKEIKTDVEIIKKCAADERLLVREQKTKLAWVISIAVFTSSLVIGIIQHFIFQAFG